eukprot:CAMPEP_0181206324 /NCGR_PEP_ID=MMETSP1096-20121128/20970_1 /TAXON_ID=156174 ORGANISM="Chrysochromulina ericina, Strain CCMP281" /NCGR_SAMPLE_ID=MMETSP1096 /ASSEMBLY_ACC=CAM_ASM_000453 /LENGTH=47 /DNA_ID= /DNA_START= /DNA_END= /DNA_ORIENTATION=
MMEHVLTCPSRTSESALVTPSTSVVEKLMQMAMIAEPITLVRRDVVI